MNKAANIQKIGYMSGPVDAVEVINRWQSGTVLDYFGTSYLSEFCSIVRERQAKAVVITYDFAPSSHHQVNEFSVHNLERHVPGGWRYHLAAISRMLRSVAILKKESVDTVVLTEGADYWFVTTLLRLRGVTIIPAAHCRMWYEHRPLKASHKLLRWLNGRFFFKGLKSPSLVASAAIARQFRAAGVSDDIPVITFLPNYHPDAFASVATPDVGSTPFRILYAGRLMRNKGPLDLVPIARLLRDRGLAFQFDVCGDGPDRAELEQEIQNYGLADVVQLHGFCARDRLLQYFSASHAVVVPTRTDCEEGFAMIVAEGALAGRPVVTSKSCPAIEYVSGAVAEVESENIADYADALTRLITDREYYAGKVAASRTSTDQFFDPANGYGAALREALEWLDARAAG